MPLIFRPYRDFRILDYILAINILSLTGQFTPLKILDGWSLLTILLIVET